MIESDRDLTLAFSDRLRFLIDDIRERLMPTKSVAEVDSLLAKHANGRNVQAYIRSSINHLAAVSDLLEGKGEKAELSAEDFGNLIAIESAINAFNDSVQGKK